MEQQQHAPDDWSNQQQANDPVKRDTEPTFDPDESRKSKNTFISDAEPFKDSGREVGLVKAPIVSLHPSSGETGDVPDKFEVFDNANRHLNHVGPKTDFTYPFLDMNIGQGFFVPVKHGGTVDSLIRHLHSSINHFQKQTSVEEKDENGDDVMESVTTLPKKRNQDGTIQLNGNGDPIVGANHTNRPKLIHMAQFIVKSAVKDDELADGRKADSDGALVIRVA